MKQITLNIEENRLKAFLEYIKTLDYVSVSDLSIPNEQQQEAESRLRLINDGTMKTRSWNEAKNLKILDNL